MLLAEALKALSSLGERAMIDAISTSFKSSELFSRGAIIDATYQQKLQRL